VQQVKQVGTPGNGPASILTAAKSISAIPGIDRSDSGHKGRVWSFGFRAGHESHESARIAGWDCRLSGAWGWQ
jgi:hypothetical protein